MTRWAIINMTEKEYTAFNELKGIANNVDVFLQREPQLRGRAPNRKLTPIGKTKLKTQRRVQVKFNNTEWKEVQKLKGGISWRQYVNKLIEKREQNPPVTLEVVRRKRR